VQHAPQARHMADASWADRLASFMVGAFDAGWR
jgi:hypothetical protein